MPDKAEKAGIIAKISALLEEKYIFPEKAKKCSAELKRKIDSYDSLNDAGFAVKLTADLQALTGDKHFRVREIEPSDIGENAASALHHPIRLWRLRKREHSGFFKLEWKEGNIACLDLRRFYSPLEAKEMLVAAMRFCSDADAVIIDLRENQGGASEMGQLLSSYLLEYPARLTGTYYREEDFLEEVWTCRKIDGAPLIRVPLFILTGPKTFSAAEYFAFDMKVTKRATIVGEPTKGGAHSVDLFKLDDRFEVYIPTARAVNPVTGGNWEGTGVLPDVSVPSASALDTAVVLARLAGRQYASAKETELKADVDAMEGFLSRAEALFRENKNDSAAAALDSLFRTAAESGLLDESFINILAYNYPSADNERILYAILKKGADLFPESPAAYESLAFGYYRNGRKAEAIENFRKVMELDPDNRNAAEMIRRLQGN